MTRQICIGEDDRIELLQLLLNDGAYRFSLSTPLILLLILTYNYIP